jgi:hypothetical protein
MLTLDALCADMEASDRYLSQRAARDWWTKGLLPRPHRRGLGRGRGTETFWTDPRVAQQAQAAYDLLADRPRADFALLGLWLLGFPISLRSIRAIYQNGISRALRSIHGCPGKRPDDIVGNLAAAVARQLLSKNGASLDAQHAFADLAIQPLEIFFGVESELVVQGLAELWEKAVPYMGAATSQSEGLAFLHPRDADIAMWTRYLEAMVSLPAQQNTIRWARDYEFMRARRLVLFVFGYLDRIARAAKCNDEFIEEYGPRFPIAFGRPAVPILIAVLRDDSLRHKIMAPLLDFLKDLPRPADWPARVAQFST